jgi:hypothetical protein
VSLGSFPASAKQRDQFEVKLPATTGNTFQGKSASIQFDWDAATA